jgi:hypothetical protein
MDEYLRSTGVIDWQCPAVLKRARLLGAEQPDTLETTRSCFEWVRDHIQHSGDHRSHMTTCQASEVLRHRTGWCFAKSHLLAALLRANGIPAGLCYQRLRRDNSDGFTLHGLNAVHLPRLGWYRIDPRGNKNGVDAQFCPPAEQLAWPVDLEGEANFPHIWPEPLPAVVNCLKDHEGWAEVESHLPDLLPSEMDAQNKALHPTSARARVGRTTMQDPVRGS